MNNYYSKLNIEIKKFFKILSPEFPKWLFKYIDTPEMQRLKGISLNCGIDYSPFFKIPYFYSNLEHSVGVALILWNFTHDKKQTLAGLFHDIATPTFKHCIDFMNCDNERQESTEEGTVEIIKKSKSIMNLLKEDGIAVEEVCDYKIYPLADNLTPRLSADRFEYNFSCGLTLCKVWSLEKIKKTYENIIIVKNEDGINEFAFKDVSIAEDYFNTTIKIWHTMLSDEDRISMQFIADICKSMNVKDYLTKTDLYTLSENEIIEKILNCKDKYLASRFKKYLNLEKVYRSMDKVKNKYCVNVKTKKRYVNPLVQTKFGVKRLSDISQIVKKQLEEYLTSNYRKYFTYFDFEFTPYKNSTDS